MIVAIMQPYFFPYLGYFQLMHCVERFVFYDDAQFMKGGWINRNRILLDGAAAWWTFPIVRDDHRLPIHRRFYSPSPQAHAGLEAKLANAYRRAPQFEEISGWISALLAAAPSNIAQANRLFAEAVAKRLGIRCEFLAASGFDLDPGLHGQERVLALCERAGASVYLNPIGGAQLYDREAFRDAGIDLRFLRSQPTDYRQAGGAHVPFLSIVDVLMFNRAEDFPALLARHEILEAA